MGKIEGTMTDIGDVKDQGNNINKSVDLTTLRFPAKLASPEYRRKVLRTVWLAGACWAMGLSMGMRGPSLLDLQIITQTTLESASAFLTASWMGNMLGAVLAGVLYDKLNKAALMIMVVIGLSVGNIVLPWCAPYGLMVAIHLFCSLFTGAIDTATNAELLRMWGQEGKKSMQFVHFSFAFGGILAPLIAEPFLTPNAETDTAANKTGATTSASAQNMTAVENTTVSKVLPLTTQVHYAYLIIGAIIFLTSVPLMFQWFGERFDKRRQDTVEEKEVKQPLPTHLLIFVLVMLCFVYFLYCAVEDTIASFLATFVVRHLSWSKSAGALISSVYWASFASGRFLSIFIVHVVPVVTLLFIYSLTLIVATLGFFLSAHYRVSEGVWLCSVGAGAALSSFFPTGFLWMERDLLRVTGRIASAILVASSLGSMTDPIILGYLMQEQTPMWFCYLLVIEAALCFCCFFLVFSLSHFYLQKHYAMSQRPMLELVVPVFDSEQKSNIELKNDSKQSHDSKKASIQL